MNPDDQRAFVRSELFARKDGGSGTVMKPDCWKDKPRRRVMVVMVRSWAARRPASPRPLWSCHGNHGFADFCVSKKNWVGAIHVRRRRALHLQGFLTAFGARLLWCPMVLPCLQF